MEATSEKPAEAVAEKPAEAVAEMPAEAMADGPYQIVDPPEDFVVEGLKVSGPALMIVFCITIRIRMSVMMAMMTVSVMIES